MTTTCVLKACFPLALVLAARLAVGQAAAGDGHSHREAGPHEHGQGAFNIAIEGKTVQMELIAPGADLVGFEHAPRTDEQNAKLTAAKAALEKIETIVALPKSAGCSLVNVDVEMPHGHRHGQDTAADKDAHKDVHSEFHITYELMCSSPAALEALTFTYFESFTGPQELYVTVVSGKGQKAFDVKRKAPQIRLDGLV